MDKPLVIIPNWNGLDFLAECLDSLQAQTLPHQVVVVDNGSTDGSKELVQDHYPEIHLIELDRNYGFAGGVNRGLEYAIKEGARFAALFNNDAVAEPTWLAELVAAMEEHPEAGIITSKFTHLKGNKLDSTGDFYSTWGLPFPRGRDEIDTDQYDDDQVIFGASGGASLYRIEMLKQIGLFDERFFAYFEDVDLSFRAQLAGWKIRYQPTAVARHHIGGTSSKHAGFSRYHTVKNFVFLYTKNMPGLLYWKYLPKYWLMAGLMFGSDLNRGLLKENLKGNLKAISQLPWVLTDRFKIQHSRKVTGTYIDSILYHQLPPTQRSFAALRKRLSRR
jgi:GT2 family glycosyltransferase